MRASAAIVSHLRSPPRADEQPRKNTHKCTQPSWIESCIWPSFALGCMLGDLQAGMSVETTGGDDDAKLAGVDWQEAESDVEETEVAARRAPRVPSAVEAQEIAMARAEPARGSLKAATLQLDYLNNHWLGKLIPNFGLGYKASAITLAASGATALSGRATVKFSKYSGIQELSDGVLLFVNVGGDSYANMFKQVARAVAADAASQAAAAATASPSSSPKDVALTWFARPKDKPESPVIARLIHSYLTERESPATPAESCPVGLFMRDLRESRIGGKAAPPLYVWCGRLSLLNVDFAANPMRFQWRLEDTAKLQHSVHFRQLIG